MFQHTTVAVYNNAAMYGKYTYIIDHMFKVKKCRSTSDTLRTL